MTEPDNHPGFWYECEEHGTILPKDMELDEGGHGRPSCPDCGRRVTHGQP